jgi:hypothetical protein
LDEFSPIGQLFTLGSFFNNRRSPNFWATFFHGKTYVLCNFGKKNSLATFWAIFKTISSGHPGPVSQETSCLKKTG